MPNGAQIALIERKGLFFIPAAALKEQDKEIKEAKRYTARNSSTGNSFLGFASDEEIAVAQESYAAVAASAGDETVEKKVAHRGVDQNESNGVQVMTLQRPRITTPGKNQNLTELRVTMLQRSRITTTRKFKALR